MDQGAYKRREMLEESPSLMDQQAPPIEDTIVVNIGDYMMRLSNDTYKSTVHRVTNESAMERVSMPFFFGEVYMSSEIARSVTDIEKTGLNFNCVESVIPSCVSETNPAKYEPISCGDCKYNAVHDYSVLISNPLCQGARCDSSSRGSLLIRNRHRQLRWLQVLWSFKLKRHKSCSTLYLDPALP